MLGLDDKVMDPSAESTPPLRALRLGVPARETHDHRDATN